MIQLHFKRILPILISAVFLVKMDCSIAEEEKPLAAPSYVFVDSAEKAEIKNEKNDAPAKSTDTDVCVGCVNPP